MRGNFLAKNNAALNLKRILLGISTVRSRLQLVDSIPLHLDLGYLGSRDIQKVGHNNANHSRVRNYENTVATANQLH